MAILALKHEAQVFSGIDFKHSACSSRGVLREGNGGPIADLISKEIRKESSLQSGKAEAMGQKRSEVNILLAIRDSRCLCTLP